jgi:hypothetical protein
MKTLATLTAAIALSIGLAGAAAAAQPGAGIGPQVSNETGIAQAGHRCYYRYFYVTNGYQYRYFYRWYCY